MESFSSLAIKGFYPRIYSAKIPPKEYFRDYLYTYIERDLRQLKNIGDLTSFQRFIQLVAGRVGQIVNFSSLASDVGVDYKTIQSWLSVLEASFIIFRLQPYFTNFGKRVIKNPKLYFYDTGLLCYLLGIDTPNELHTHFSYGAIFENFIITDYSKRIQNARSNEKLFFWRDSNGNEVDLLIDRGATQIPVGIKAGKTFSTDMLKGLNYWQALQKNPTIGYLVYNGDLETNQQNNKVVNWKTFCL